MTNLNALGPLWRPAHAPWTVCFDEGFSRPWRLMPVAGRCREHFPVEVSETDERDRRQGFAAGRRAGGGRDHGVTNDVLTIKAEHKETTEDKKRDFYRREIRYGSFHRVAEPAGERGRRQGGGALRERRAAPDPAEGGVAAAEADQGRHGAGGNRRLE